jgi:hypothetical protein
MDRDQQGTLKKTSLDMLCRGFGWQTRWCLNVAQMKMAAQTGSHFHMLVEVGGIGLAGRAFACMRMPLRATNSTQVLFV